MSSTTILTAFALLPVLQEVGIQTTPHSTDIEFDAKKLPTVSARQPAETWKPLENPPAVANDIDYGHWDKHYGDIVLSTDGAGPKVKALNWDFLIGLPSDGAGSIWFIGRDSVESFSPHVEGLAISKFGESLSWVPDISGDGVRDLLVGASGKGRDSGHVVVVDVMNRSIVQVVPCPDDQPTFGRTVCGVPDIDGDGLGEIAVGIGVAEDVTSLIGLGARIFAGGTGKLLATYLHGQKPTPHSNGSLTWNGGDSVTSGHLLISQPALEDGRLTAIDLSNGTEAWTTQSDRPGLKFGARIESFVDTDGDNVPEILVGSLANGRGLSNALGRVALISGDTGTRLYQVMAPRGSPTGDDMRFGTQFARYPDQDEDGIDEFLVASECLGFSGSFFCVSGKSGRPLKAVAFIAFDELFHVGHRVALCSDWDGDGSPEVCTTSNVPSAHAHAFGVFSPMTGKVFAEVSREEFWPFILNRPREE